MKASKVILLFTTSAILAGCGMQSITPEEAGKICEEILDKLRNDEFTYPTKAIVENEEYTKYPGYSETEHKAKFSLDLDKETFHLTEQLKRTSGDTTTITSLEVWSWKEDDKYRCAVKENHGGEKKSYWSYSDYLETSKYKMEDEVYFSFYVVSSLSILSEERLKDDYDDGTKWSLKSAGEGSLLFTISGTDNGIAFDGKINIKNNLLTDYYVSGGDTTSHYTFAWGKSSFRKPSLKNFDFTSEH